MTAAHNMPEFTSERALLGAAITSTDLALAVIGKVRAAEIRDPANRTVYEMVVDLAGQGHQISPGVVLAEIAKTDKLVAGGLDANYLHELFEGRALPDELDYHVGNVKARAFKVGLDLLGARCRQLASDQASTPEDDAELLQSWFDELMGTGGDGGTSQAADLIYEVLDEIEQGSDRDVVTTGFTDLDALMSIRPGQLIVVGARPGAGKSTLGMDLARHVGINLREPVYVLTLEMGRKELMKRMISAEAKVSLHSLLHHRLGKELLTDDDWRRMNDATKRIQDSSITIDDAPGVGLARVRARLRHMKRTGGVRIAVIDYLGIMCTSGRAETQEQAIAQLTRGLKQIAREIEIPIILLAQLNRQVMGRQDRKPMSSDLKGSGAIEADADAVILIHRDDLYEKESPRAGEADLIVDKHRSGPTATVTVVFQGHYSRFMDMAADPSPPSSPPGAGGHLRAVQ